MTGLSFGVGEHTASVDISVLPIDFDHNDGRLQSHDLHDQLRWTIQPHDGRAPCLCTVREALNPSDPSTDPPPGIGWKRKEGGWVKLNELCPVRGPLSRFVQYELTELVDSGQATEIIVTMRAVKLWS